MRTYPLIFALWVLIFSPNYAGESGGTTGMSFLKVGVGARAAGMGEAFVAVSDDALATYWNPAGLSGATRSNLALMHNKWIAGVNSQFGALQFRTQTAGLGFHVYSFSVDDIPVRDRPTAEPLEQTGANFLSLGISYARQLGPDLDVGLTAKYLFEKVFVQTAGGYALDFGVRYGGLGENLTLAGVVQNLGSMGELDREATELPVMLRLGAGYRLPNPVGGVQLLFAGDVVKPSGEDVRIHLGGEAGLWESLILRGGYQAGYESRSFSVGAGIHKSAFHFDYSYTPFSDDLGSGQRFSVYLAL